ncbi:MAG: energy-coupling factor ABC transporter ATP-binding protein [Candidatus Heimdallarchaeota archaeon]
MTYLEIKDITFQYNPKHKPAIQSTTLEFSLGEQVAIIGENGAGKTTLAKLIIGMLNPQKGSIRIDGKSTAKLSIADIAEQIGYVFQNPNVMLFTNTIEKELELSLLRFNFTKEEKQKKINEILEFFNLTKYKTTHPRLLSRGEKQKLALAAVLIQEPKTIILDEPFSGIDRSQKSLLMDYIHELKAQGKLVIIVSHDLDSIIEETDRIIALHEGKIAYDMPTLDFFNDKKRLHEIGLVETKMLKMFFNLRKNGLPKDILRKKDLVSFLKTKLKGS